MLYFLVSSVIPLGTQNGETAVILAAQKGHRELLLHLVNHYKCAAQEKDNVSLTSQPPHLRLCVVCKPVLCYTCLCLLACACVCMCVCAQISRSALSHACEHGHLGIVRLMVRSFGCSVGERSKVSEVSRVYSLRRLMSVHMFLYRLDGLSYMPRLDMANCTLSRR